MLPASAHRLDRARVAAAVWLLRVHAPTELAVTAEATAVGKQMEEEGGAVNTDGGMEGVWALVAERTPAAASSSVCAYTLFYALYTLHFTMADEL